MGWMSWEQIIDDIVSYNFLNIGVGEVDFSLIYHIEFENTNGQIIRITSNEELELFRTSVYDLDQEGWGTECNIQINSVAMKKQAEKLVEKILDSTKTMIN
jgi:hypothetical protein